MTTLSPLEFNDCVIDGPYFRQSLEEHEKEISNACKGVKAIYNSVQQVFDAMQVMSSAFRDLAACLREYPILAASGPQSPLLSPHDSEETQDEKVIHASLETYAQMIENIEDMRSELMLGPAKDLVMNEMESLKTKWFSSTKDDAKKFAKETSNYCQKLDKYVSTKPKSSENNLKEADRVFQDERRKFISCSMDHVFSIQRAHEKKKYKFVGSVSLLVQMMSTFHHQAWEQFVDSKRKMDDINSATQRIQEGYKAIHERTKILKDKLLATQPEKVKSSNGRATREGYLYLLNKKTVTNQWIKYFCAYQKDKKTFTRMPYTQTSIAKLPLPESFRVKSCVRRPVDSVERRFCFDVEVEDKTNPFTLQALTDEDLHHWLIAMDGTEPILADNNSSTLKLEPGRTLINANGFMFLRRCLEEIERRGLEDQGLYRLTGAKLKLDKFMQSGLEENGIGRMRLDNREEHDTKILASAVKQYIRNLTEPLMTFALHDKFISIAKQKDGEKRISLVGDLLKQLPPDNFNTLSLLIQHLHKVSQKSDQNLMPPANLGVVFGPTIFRPAHESVAAIMEIKFAGVVVELLVQNAPKFFPRPPVSPPVGGGSQTSGNGGGQPITRTHSLQGSGDEAAKGGSQPPSGSNGGLMERLSNLKHSKSFRQSKTSSDAPRQVKSSSESASPQQMTPSGSKSRTDRKSITLSSTPPKTLSKSAGNGAADDKMDNNSASKSSSSDMPTEKLSRNHAGRATLPTHSTLQSPTRSSSSSFPRPHSVTSEKPGGGRVVAWAPDTPHTSHGSPLMSRLDLTRRSTGSHFVPNGRKARTLYRCIGENDKELSFESNKIIFNVRSSGEAGWLVGEMDGRSGLVPMNYVEMLT